MISPAHILVVDDDDCITQLMSDVLSAEYQVDTANNAAEGLNCLRQNNYDLLILDLGLPGMSGAELVRLLRADPVVNHLPILIVSAYPDLRQMVPKEMVSGFLEKPFSLVKLWKGVRDIVERPVQSGPEDYLKNADGGLLAPGPLWHWSRKLWWKAQIADLRSIQTQYRSWTLLLQSRALVAVGQELIALNRCRRANPPGPLAITTRPRP